MPTVLALFLRDHGGTHSRYVSDVDITMDWIVDGLDEADLRAMPHDLNAIAWLLWHVARVEDACVHAGLLAETQVLDDPSADWPSRLGIDRRDDGSAMTKSEVCELADSISIPALMAYRNAVGRRTRELVSALRPDRWDEPLTETDVNAGIAAGVFAPDERHHVGTPRERLLWWWGVHHTIYHLGQAAMVGAARIRARS